MTTRLLAWIALAWPRTPKPSRFDELFDGPDPAVHITTWLNGRKCAEYGDGRTEFFVRRGSRVAP